MDAPVLPPSQENIPAIVTSATEPAQPPLIPALLGSASVWQAVHGTQARAHTFPHSSQNSSSQNSSLSIVTPFDLAQISVPAGFWAWPQLTNSFSFVERTLRAAQINDAQSDPDSAAVPPERSQLGPQQDEQPDNGQTFATVSEVKVKRVTPTAEMVAAENAGWADAFTAGCLPHSKGTLQAGPLYQISLRKQTLGYVAGEGHAYLLAEQLKRALRQASFAPEAIAPSSTQPYADSPEAPSLMVSADGRQLFAINSSMAEAIGYTPEWAAIIWANNLRVALATKPLSPVEAQRSLKGLQTSEASLSGKASWYGPYFHGRITANGETFNQNDLTVAHKSLPFDTRLQIRNLLNDQTVIVRVNDRGPYVGDRSLDLSKAAARCLGSEQVGVIPYEAVILKEAQPIAVATKS